MDIKALKDGRPLVVLLAAEQAHKLFGRFRRQDRVQPVIADALVEDVSGIEAGRRELGDRLEDAEVVGLDIARADDEALVRARAIFEREHGDIRGMEAFERPAWPTLELQVVAVVVVHVEDQRDGAFAARWPGCGMFDQRGKELERVDGLAGAALAEDACRALKHALNVNGDLDRLHAERDAEGEAVVVACIEGAVERLLVGQRNRDEVVREAASA